MTTTESYLCMGCRPIAILYLPLEAVIKLGREIEGVVEQNKRSD